MNYITDTEDKIRTMKIAVSNVIRRAMNNNNLSQKETSDKYGVNRSDLCQVVNGNVDNFSLTKIISYAMVIGVDVELQFREKLCENTIRVIDFVNQGT
ncbi:XRE family transcriptional regulator [Roseovarius atlanticus]|uniref:XRE family transcriptional regulator n=1 Tax=Roseovarius atlanticus TaxID=1641875 RepID=UPI00070FFF96|nr:XRE family transcriptional regulator [Roseovarius atlanticus]